MTSVPRGKICTRVVLCQSKLMISIVHESDVWLQKDKRTTSLYLSHVYHTSSVGSLRKGGFGSKPNDPLDVVRRRGGSESKG